MMNERIDFGPISLAQSGVTSKMGFDMVVALPGTTPDGQTLFGHNGSRPGDEGQALHRQSARAHAPGETLIFGSLAIPQARQTHSVLGWQTTGQWGYRHG